MIKAERSTRGEKVQNLPTPICYLQNFTKFSLTLPSGSFQRTPFFKIKVEGLASHKMFTYLFLYQEEGSEVTGAVKYEGILTPLFLELALILELFSKNPSERLDQRTAMLRNEIDYDIFST